MTTTTETLPVTEIITPASEADVAAAVRRACEAGTAVYPIGGGTSLDYGARPSRPGIGVSTAMLDRVIDHAADDMTITVEAGLTMAELAKQLATQRQRLPLDVAKADWATIGGVVATNLSGPRRYGCGTMRDYVIGLRAVDGRGTLFSGGGRVVKNAAGYNVCRLLTGSLGTLGMITQITLMVRPMPETSALVACEVPDLDTAERLLAGLVHTKTLPAAIELEAGSGPPENPSLGPLPAGSAARLIVGFEGTEVEVQWMEKTLRDEWYEAGVSSTVTMPGTETGRLWQWLAEFPAHVQIGVRPGATVAVVEQLLSADPGCSVLAHAGDGVIRARLVPFDADEFVELLGETLRPAAAEAGGNLVVLSPPEDIELTAREIWGPPGNGATVMRALKDRFDPDGILNPGRFVYEDL